MTLDNSIALVTGAAGGIGTAICRALADQGCCVVAGVRSMEKAVQWNKQQKADGYSFLVKHIEVTDIQSCSNTISEIEQNVGAIEVLVNNAGITRDVQFRKMTIEQWNEVLQTNLTSLFNVTHALINNMIERNYGRIINIASINGQRGQFGQTNYAASKAGMHGFTKALAQEVARKGITVNTVAPGYILTEMVKAVAEEQREKIAAQIPMGRFGKPEEVARLVAFLAAKESSYITGAEFSINGGLFMH